MIEGARGRKGHLAPSYENEKYVFREKNVCYSQLSVEYR